MKLLSALLSLFLIITSLVFALSNRQNVSVSLWPFGMDMDAPLYVMTLGALAAGLVVGGFCVWLTALPHRFLAKRLGKDVALLSGKILELEQELEQHRAHPAAPTPSLLDVSRWRFWQRFS